MPSRKKRHAKMLAGGESGPRTGVSGSAAARVCGAPSLPRAPGTHLSGSRPPAGQALRTLEPQPLRLSVTCRGGRLCPLLAGSKPPVSPTFFFPIKVSRKG